jgi:hypothetical protein
MFFFPFGFLIPALFIFLAIRFGMRLFHDAMRRHERLKDGRGGQGLGRSWLDGTLGPFYGGRLQTMEARVFRAAYKMKGRLTVSDIVLETGLTVSESEELANSMVDGMRVRMEVNDDGLVFYEFPEIIARFEDG